MKNIDLNALELCMQVGGERFGQRVFPNHQFELPNLMKKRNQSTVKDLYYRKNLQELITDCIIQDVDSIDPDRKLKHGSLLSGGVDSSLMTWILNKQDIHLEAHAQKFTGRNEWEHAKFMANFLDIPFHLHSALAEDQIRIFHESTQVLLPAVGLPHVYLMFKEMAEKGVNVAWSGLGIDEYFAGYTIHRRYYNRPKLRFIPDIFPHPSKPRRALTFLFGTNDALLKDWTFPFRSIKFVNGSNINYKQLFQHFRGDLWNRIFDANMDALVWNYIEHTRQIAAFFGITVMFPYLNTSLIAYGRSLSPEDAYNKKLIRELMKNVGLPERIYSRGADWGKCGWGDPVQYLWNVNEFRDMISVILDELDSGLFNRHWYRKTINRKTSPWTKRVYIQMALTELMIEKFLNGKVK